MKITFAGFVRQQLRKTLITGIPQIIQAHGICRKLIKIVVFVVCVAACLYQICSFLNVYYQYPIIVDVFVSTPAEIREPAITICPHNSIKAYAYCRQSKDCTDIIEKYRNFCDDYFFYCLSEDEPNPLNPKFMPIVPVEGILQYPEFSAEKLKAKYLSLTHRDNFVENAELNGGEINLISDHQRFLAFDGFGLPAMCLAFRVKWPNWTSATEEIRNVTLNSVYKFELNTDTKHMFYAAIPNAIQVAVHDPLEKVNPFETGFALKACETHKIFLHKTEKFLLPPPYPTMCEDYMTKWKERRGEGPLTQNQCIEECVLNKTVEKYGCFNSKVIKIPNDKAICPGNKKANSTKDNTNWCRRQCPDACWQISFEASIEPDIREKPKNVDEHSCRTEVDIILKKMNVMTFTYKRKYESVEIFGYVGGYLGMWLGFSLIAAFDFFEVMMSIIFYGCKKNKKKTTPISYYSTPKQMFI